jgi:murein DD-endopeptidase MepM/ murein hydrolase activator NlpD
MQSSRKVARWRLASRLLAGALLLAVAAPPTLGVIDDPAVREAKQTLRAAKERVLSKRERLRVLNRELEDLATRISDVETRIEQTTLAIVGLRERLARNRARRRELIAKIEQRSAIAFIEGPGSSLEMILRATDYQDFLDRLAMLDVMNFKDGRLAAALAAVSHSLELTKGRLLLSRQQRGELLDELEDRRRQMREKFAEQQQLLAELEARREQARASVWRLRPLAVCPVAGPHAVADDWGAPRVGPPKHKHQGNDIFAPYGTPIVAPFPGYAETARNRLGGLAVKVHGQYGYVYNAHMSRYGQLGQVETGDVIGYVGTTGNAQGTSPHDHFEWHPGGGSAVDPHGFLMLVC